MQIRDIEASDRASLQQLLRCIDQFKAEEVAIALALADDALRGPSETGYECLVAIDPELCGYICFGPTPMTAATWDLYWIAVSPDVQGRGVGRALYRAFVARMRARGGRQVRIETSSQESYGDTGRFYERLGFRVDGRLCDFYGPGDDLLIYYQRLE